MDGSKLKQLTCTGEIMNTQMTGEPKHQALRDLVSQQLDIRWEA